MVLSELPQSLNGQPCKLYHDSKLQLTETKIAHLKALLEEIKDSERTEHFELIENEVLDVDYSDGDLDAQ